PIPVPDAETNTAGIQAGFTRVFNEHLNGIFLLGGRHLKTINHQLDANLALQEVTDSNNGGLATIGVTYTGERFEASATPSQDLTPSGLGVLFDRQKLIGDLAYRLRENLHVHLGVEAYNNDLTNKDALERQAITTGQRVLLNRKFYALRPSLKWTFRERWSL